MLRKVLRAVRTFCVLGGLFLLVAEGVARLDDWLQYDVPLNANPDRERDLTIVDDHGIHGRPHGRYRKWELNSFGFRGPEITEQPSNGTTRVMIIGASETFGLYESPGKEYPRQLAEILKASGQGCFEIVNAAMAGITLPTMKGYWNSWASRFGAQVVLIYPSPIFYLDEKAPGTHNSVRRRQSRSLHRASTTGSSRPCGTLRGCGKCAWNTRSPLRIGGGRRAGFSASRRKSGLIFSGPTSQALWRRCGPAARSRSW